MKTHFNFFKSFSLAPTFFLGFALLFFLGACQPESAEKKPTPPQTPPPRNTAETLFSEEQLRRAGIAWGKAEITDNQNTKALTGTVIVPPAGEHILSAPVGAFVVDCQRQPGERVRKGQVLLTLQHPDLILWQNDFLKNEEEIKFLVQEVERQRAMQETQATSARALQDAERKLAQAQSTREAEALRLKMVGISPEALRKKGIQPQLALRATQDGFLAEIHARKGKYFAQNESLLRLVSDRELLLQFEIFGEARQQLRQGEHIRFALPGETSLEREAKVTLIHQEVDGPQRVLHALAKPENTAGLTPGLYLRGQLEQGEGSQVPTLPAEAVQETTQGLRAFKLEEVQGKFRLVAVDFPAGKLQGEKALLPGLDTQALWVRAGGYAASALLP